MKISSYVILLFTLIGCNKENQPEPAPIAPSNLTATIISSSQIDLSWNDNADNETGFKIERKSGSEDYMVIATTGENISIYSDANLEEFTDYTYRIFAFNSQNGIGEYSNEIIARTFGKAVFGTPVVSDITPFSATFENNIIQEKGSQVIVRGVVWSTAPNPTIDLDKKTEDGSGSGNYSSGAIGLNWETKYYVRSYATNGAGTSYSEEITFSTSAIEITTSPVTDINHNSAICGGSIGGEGGTSILSRGLVWDIESNPTIDLSSKTEDSTGTGSFISRINNLLPNTKYYVRAYVSNNVTTSYASEISFITRNNVTDIDGNSYPIVAIGSQIWMAENLKTTKYNDGTNIPLVTDRNEWSNLTTPAYTWFENNYDSYGIIYGAMYNWFSVETSKLCPTGWHIPSNEEWSILTEYLGGELVAGGKIKESGTIHWKSPNIGATNESGFNALPGGNHYLDGGFFEIGTYGGWWSSSANVSDDAWTRAVYNDKAEILRFGSYRKNGHSCRCLSD